MEIPRHEIVAVLQALSRPDDAEHAEATLPDQVDPEAHADLLDRYGLDADTLATLAEREAHTPGSGGLLEGEGV